MAGVSYTLSDAWRLLLGYRFMGMSGPDFETGGVPLHGDPIQTHAVQAGVDSISNSLKQRHNRTF